MHQIHHGPEQEKEVTEDEWLSAWENLSHGQILSFSTKNTRLTELNYVSHRHVSQPEVKLSESIAT